MCIFHQFQTWRIQATDQLFRSFRVLMPTSRDMWSPMSLLNKSKPSFFFYLTYRIIYSYDWGSINLFDFGLPVPAKGSTCDFRSMPKQTVDLKVVGEKNHRKIDFPQTPVVWIVKIDRLMTFSFLSNCWWSRHLIREGHIHVDFLLKRIWAVCKIRIFRMQ